MVKKQEKDFSTCKMCGTRKNVKLYFQHNDKTGVSDLPIIMCEKCWQLDVVKKMAKFGMLAQAKALAEKWGLKIIED